MLLISGIWLLVAIVLSLKQGLYLISIGREVFWFHTFLFYLGSSLSWILFTPVIFRFCRWQFGKTSPWYSKLAWHLLFLMLLIPAQTVVFLFIHYITPYDASPASQAELFRAYLTSFSFLVLLLEGVITYCVLASLLTGYLFYRRNQRVSLAKAKLEEHLMRSRVQNLKYQLQPHFLFNAMQTISNLMHLDVKKADEAVAGLSEILRFSIAQLNTDFIRLKEEVDLTTKYLEFQKLRFGEMVEYTIKAPEALHKSKVPALLLQPLVENSIKYGFEKTGQAVTIRINIASKQEQLSIVVSDNGPGFSRKSTSNSEGIGLPNLENRLKLFYQQGYSLDISDQPQGTEVRIEIPKIDHEEA